MRFLRLGDEPSQERIGWPYSTGMRSLQLLTAVDVHLIKYRTKHALGHHLADLWKHSNPQFEVHWSWELLLLEAPIAVLCYFGHRTSEEKVSSKYSGTSLLFKLLILVLLVPKILFIPAKQSTANLKHETSYLWVPSELGSILFPALLSGLYDR